MINTFCKLYETNRNTNGAGVFIYVCAYMPSKDLEVHNLVNDIRYIY